MPETSEHNKALEVELRGVHQELQKQQIINNRLFERISNLEEALLRKEPVEESDHSSSNSKEEQASKKVKLEDLEEFSSHSSSSNRAFNLRESEKEEALTTFNSKPSLYF